MTEWNSSVSKNKTECCSALVVRSEAPDVEERIGQGLPPTAATFASEAENSASAVNGVHTKYTVFPPDLEKFDYSLWSRSVVRLHGCG